MSRKRKTRGPKPTLDVASRLRVPRPKLDPESGLPPVGAERSLTPDELVARARAKHRHRS